MPLEDPGMTGSFPVLADKKKKGTRLVREEQENRIQIKHNGERGAFPRQIHLQTKGWKWGAVEAKAERERQGSGTVKERERFHPLLKGVEGILGNSRLQRVWSCYLLL
jgi:hypothetical protein